MSRYYKVNYGRKTVRPFKLEDAKNIMIMLQKNEMQLIMIDLRKYTTETG